MLLHQRFIPGLAIHSYVVGDERSGDAAVIDPTRDVDEFVQFAAQNGLRIRHILETHVHADFVSGARELKAALGDEPTIHCSGYGGPEWTQPFADHQLREGDTISLGSVRLGCVHTPGHTPEHIAITLTDTSRSQEVPWLIFSGDFLFVGDVGRPDLLGPAAQRRLASDLYRSLFEKLPGLPDFTEVFPAHGAGSLCGKALSSRRSSTIGYERRFNPALVAKPEEQWVKDLLAGMPLAPPYFRRMKSLNRDGPPILGPERPGTKRWSPQAVRQGACGGAVVLDVRAKESFAAAHIPGSLNIPVGPALPTWAGWVLPYDRPLLLLADDDAAAVEAVTHLSRVGFDAIAGCIAGGIDGWVAAGYPIATLATVSVHDLARMLASAEPPLLVDVRGDGEWHASHVAGAIHIHGGTLLERLTEIPRGPQLAVLCGSGYRSSIAASILAREGYERIVNVLGGMTAWRAAGLPIA